MYQHKEPELIKKLRTIKNYFERFYVILVCILWIVATCWDIYKLQRYWFDYALEFYITFLIFITLLYSLSPKAISYNIYKSFKMITRIKGRGIMFIIISLLFFRDKYDLHKFCSYILLIAGVLCFVCEILIPTTKEELIKIDEFYEKNTIKINNDVVVFNKQNEQNNIEEKGEENNNEKLDKNEEKKVEIKLDNDITSEEQNIKNLNNDIIVNNQSTNPYDLPEDF